MGCRVYDSDLAAIKERFDIVTLFDVIEHVPQPVETMRVVRQLLRPGGLVLVFESELRFTCDPRDPRGVETSSASPTRHLSYFARSSVDKLCELAGLKLSWFRTAGIDIGDIMSWSESHAMPRDLALWQRLSDALQPVSWTTWRSVTICGFWQWTQTDRGSPTMDNYQYVVNWVQQRQGSTPRPLKVLDYGCGQGATVKMLRDRGIEAYGCDAFVQIGKAPRDYVSNPDWFGSVFEGYARGADPFAADSFDGRGEQSGDRARGEH